MWPLPCQNTVIRGSKSGNLFRNNTNYLVIPLDLCFSFWHNIHSPPQCCLSITLQLPSTGRGNLFQCCSLCQLRHTFTLSVILYGCPSLAPWAGIRQVSIGAKYAERRLGRAGIKNPFNRETHIGLVISLCPKSYSQRHPMPVPES